MAAGFLYVLVNSSMPGLIKVGKTTRLPSERVGELSGVTGVPTPFIVAYEEHFSDCDSAEQFVHAKLTEQGVRVSDSREFFRATASDVVKIIASTPSTLAIPKKDGTATKAAYPKPLTEPWRAIFESAEDFYFGRGDHLQNDERAFKLYQDAAKLGSLRAVECVGEMYWSGQAVREDKAKAIELFLQSALAGNYSSYGRLATAYCFVEKYGNGLKAARNFIVGGEAAGWGKFQEYPDSHLSQMFHIVDLFGIYDEAREWQSKIVEVFHSYTALMLASGRVALEYAQRAGKSRRQSSIQNTMQVLQSYLE
jgi:hypothetical protein